MRALWLGAVAVLAFPAPAAAKPVTVAPPGNSAVNQYVESVPTAGGGRPDGSIHTGSGAPGRSGGSSGGTGGSGAGSIPAATQRSLNAQGADGQRAAALAAATAPTSTGTGSGSGSGSGSSGASNGSHRGSHRPSGANVAPAHSTAAATQGTSPLSAVLKALTGSTSSGGLGLLLPVILVVSLLGVSAIGIARRRRTT